MCMLWLWKRASPQLGERRGVRILPQGWSSLLADAVVMVPSASQYHTNILIKVKQPSCCQLPLAAFLPLLPQC